MNRVVITGMSGTSPIGSDWADISKNLKAQKTGISYCSEWSQYEGLETRLCGKVENFSKPEHYSRKDVRSMGRVALMATEATERALSQAGLLGNEVLRNGRTGLAYGSSSGSPPALADFGNMLLSNTTKGINANSYIKMMSHTTAVNIGVFFGITGRVYTTSSACTSGSQALGYAYEAIKLGKQDVMVAGGAEELCPTQAAVFDTLFAASTNNDNPHRSPRPFDVNRDGLVIGEGACSLIIESLEHAQQRQAPVLAEIVGYATNSDGTHVTQPNSQTMHLAMRGALDDAKLNAEDIGYINAHGTATARGDIAESHATHKLFAGTVPISSLKSYTGHTLGACGALEAMVSINCMNEGWFFPTANLEQVDPECAALDYIQNNIREVNANYIMSNNFAFGGINTSLVFKRWQQ